MTSSNISSGISSDTGFNAGNAAPIDIAKHYFDLSNQGDLDAIALLFAKDATYSSAHTGLYFGREAIMAMMQEFFASYQTRRWHVNSIWEVNSSIIGFDFTFKGMQAALPDTPSEAQHITREGIEHIIVGGDCLIRHIEVRPKTESKPE